MQAHNKLIHIYIQSSISIHVKFMPRIKIDLPTSISLPKIFPYKQPHRRDTHVILDPIKLKTLTTIIYIWGIGKIIK